MKLIKLIPVFIGIMLGWLIILSMLRSIARRIVRYLAFNITDSWAFPDCETCFKFGWDTKLQIATYSLYAFLFCIIITIIRKILRSSNDSYLNRVLAGIFIMSSRLTHNGASIRLQLGGGQVL